MTCAPDDLAPLTTLRLPARATERRDVYSRDELREALTEARALDLPVIVLGAGSNVVFAGDVRALVLRYREQGTEVLEDTGDSVLLRIAGGEDWHALVRYALDAGYGGLENLALIPGTVGAAPIQNIGAYGVELATFVDRVHVMHIDSGRTQALPAKACGFAYRDSVFKGMLADAVVITHVDLRLPCGSNPETSYPSLRERLGAGAATATAREVFDAVVALRRERLPDPALVPNAGSFFKNPVVDEGRAAALRERFPAMPQYAVDGGRKLAAGWLIDHCGWRGFRENGVGVHVDHALVLVNERGDGAALLALASRIRASVAATFGCELEIEPRVYGIAA